MNMKKENKRVELKISPVDNGGFIVKTFDQDGDQRIPTLTLVAGDTANLITLIGSIYPVTPNQ